MTNPKKAEKLGSWKKAVVTRCKISVINLMSTEKGGRKDQTGELAHWNDLV